MRILRSAFAVTAVMALGLSACTTSTPTEPEESADTAASEPAPTEGGDESEPAGGDETSTEDVPMGDGSQTIYLVSKGFQHRFWQAVNEGAQQAGEEFNYNVEFVGPDDETQVTQQINQLDAALASQPAAIGFAALDTTAAIGTLEQIEAAGIPIIAFDSGVDSDLPVTTVATDNRAAAEEAASHMADLIDHQGKVGIVCHDQTSATARDRCEGFADWMEENEPDIELLQTQYAGEVGQAANAANSLVAANPDLVGIYGSNEAAATGTVQGVTESGRDDVTVVGFDSSQTQLAAIRSGQQAGAVTQAPVLMGYETVVAAIRAINEIEQPEEIDSGFAWYDASNMDDPEIAENLYE